MKMLLVNDESLRYAAEILKAGGIAAFPTETVYGLGGDALNPSALARIFEAKGRPHFDPLIIHIAALEALEDVADLSLLDREARRRLEILALRLWPGPLTLVLPKQPWVPGLATSGLATAAVRFPAHPAARELIRLSTGAVAAPSANLFGRLSPTRAEHVRDQLGEKVDLILDGGRCQVGVESTVLDLCSGPPRILRPGGVSRERLEALIGPVQENAESGGSSGEKADPVIVTSKFSAAETALVPAAVSASPGQLKSHYAPRTPLSVYPLESMIALTYKAGEGYLFFDGPSRDAWIEGLGPASLPSETASGSRIRVLSAEGNLREAAANLFDALHKLDSLGLTRIRAEQAPSVGLGPAINDRLSRAAQRPQPEAWRSSADPYSRRG